MSATETASTRTPARAEVTPWFPTSIRPHRPGWYEVRSIWLNPGSMRYWSGMGWAIDSTGRSTGFGSGGDEWRGLTIPVGTQIVLSAADAVMSPDQRNLFDQIGERDPGVYARLLSRIVKMLAGEAR